MVEPAFPPQRNVHLARGDRLLYAAILYRSHKAPLVVVTGGITPRRESEPNEGESTAQALGVMGVPPSAILEEPSSNNTYQEARVVKQLMRSHKMDKILLVTSAMHMPRALRTFRRQGIDSIPSPTDFAVTEYDVAQSDATFEKVALNLIPDAGVLVITTAALKEYIGLAYYWARHWL
ncbi:MAG: YdcF family protein [Acidobacteria bacterium]|nr:YdcF family protein [Acidobacteriota bacterium]